MTKKRVSDIDTLFTLYSNYSAEIAPTGHTPAHVPQSTHVFASISLL